MRVLKKTSFGLMAIILVVLAVGTILQKIDSSAVAAYTCLLYTSDAADE